jgi:hypothetical protein
MDTQELINIGIGTGLAVVGWLARTLWEAVQNLRADIHKIEVDLPTTYIRRDEFSDGMKELKDMISLLFKKIEELKDRKADK